MVTVFVKYKHSNNILKYSKIRFNNNYLLLIIIYYTVRYTSIYEQIRIDVKSNTILLC